MLLKRDGSIVILKLAGIKLPIGNSREWSKNDAPGSNHGDHKNSDNDLSVISGYSDDILDGEEDVDEEQEPFGENVILVSLLNGCAGILLL